MHFDTFHSNIRLATYYRCSCGDWRHQNHNHFITKGLSIQLKQKESGENQGTFHSNKCLRINTTVELLILVECYNYTCLNRRAKINCFSF